MLALRPADAGLRRCAPSPSARRTALCRAPVGRRSVVRHRGFPHSSRDRRAQEAHWRRWWPLQRTFRSPPCPPTRPLRFAGRPWFCAGRPGKRASEVRGFDEPGPGGGGGAALRCAPGAGKPRARRAPVGGPPVTRLAGRATPRTAVPAAPSRFPHPPALLRQRAAGAAVRCVTRPPLTAYAHRRSLPRPPRLGSRLRRDLEHNGPPLCQPGPGSEGGVRATLTSATKSRAASCSERGW